MLREAGEKEERRALIQKVSEGLVLLDEAFANCSKGKAYFGGDTIGYLDIVFGSCLGWLRVTEIVVEVELLDQAKTPGLAKWADKFCSDDAVKAVYPETQMLLELYKKIQDFVKSA